MKQLASVFGSLHASHVRGTDGASLVDLISKLLVWKPQDRWSAEEALEHECWLPIASRQDRRFDDLVEVIGVKRALLNHPRSEPEGQYPERNL